LSPAFGLELRHQLLLGLKFVGLLAVLVLRPSESLEICH
jgi:hypothetical protein